jgi:uncharacterized protein (DUF1330 family)
LRLLDLSVLAKRKHRARNEGNKNNYVECPPGKTPGAYAILDVSEVVDAPTMKSIVAKAIGSVKAGGGQYLVRTDKITALNGVPPKRVVIIAFDSTDEAKAW